MAATVTSYADLDAAYRKDTCHGDAPPSSDEQLADFLDDFFSHSARVQAEVYADLSPVLQDAIDRAREVRNRGAWAAVMAACDALERPETARLERSA